MPFVFEYWKIISNEVDTEIERKIKWKTEIKTEDITQVGKLINKLYHWENTVKLCKW